MNPLLDAPIPGQSLTAPVGANGLPGSAPYEKPPQFANLSDALNFVWEKLTSERKAMELVLMLKKGIPAQYIAKTLLFEGAAQGTWSYDVAAMMQKTVIMMIVSIGHLAGVGNLKIRNPDTGKKEFLNKFLDLLDTKEEVKEEPATPFKGLLNG